MHKINYGALYVNDLYIHWATIYILSWTTKKHQKILSRLLHSKLRKIQALFKDLHRNLRTFQDCANPVHERGGFPHLEWVFRLPFKQALNQWWLTMRLDWQNLSHSWKEDQCKGKDTISRKQNNGLFGLQKVHDCVHLCYQQPTFLECIVIFL